MGSIGIRRALVGAGLVVAIGGASATAVLFSGGTSPQASGRDSVGGVGRHQDGRRRRAPRRRARPPRPRRRRAACTRTGAGVTGAGRAAAPAPAPAPEPAPAPSGFSAPACDGGAGGTAGAVVAAMNGDRAANGRSPLCWNNQMGGIAQSWANWMAANQSLSHQDLGSVLGGHAVLDGRGEPAGRADRDGRRLDGRRLDGVVGPPCEHPRWIHGGRSRDRRRAPTVSGGSRWSSPAEPPGLAGPLGSMIRRRW